MRANPLLKANIDGLLRVQHRRKKDLAAWCWKSESWITKILKEPRRDISIVDLDRIADFFGLVVYQLFQPGIVGVAERRTGAERRSAQSDRRKASPVRGMLPTAAETQQYRPRQRMPIDGVPPDQLETFHRLTAEYEQQIAHLLSGAADTRRQTVSAGEVVPRPRAADRAPGGSGDRAPHPEKKPPAPRLK